MSTVNFGANWLYMDDRDIAYVHTGLYPVRPLAVDPDMVSWGTGEWEWQGFLGAAQHPHELNPSTGYLTSWNNKPAPAWSATDGYYGWSALYRAKMLNDQIEPNHAITPVQLVQMMERVGLTDMRGSLDLPFLLRVLDKTGAPGPRESEMESLLKSWLAAGPYRLDNGHGNAVAIMDAWWPALIPAMYNPVMGDVSKVPLGFDNSPGAAGSAYQDGFYGQVWTDLSMLLGGAVKSPTHRVYCGGTATQPGDVQRCSRALWGALRSAGDSLQQQQGSNNPAAWDYSAQAERIRFLPAAAVSMQWVNRPTFQQLEEFSGHRPAGLTSLPAVAALQALPNTSTAPVVVFLLALVLAAALAFRALTRSPRPAG